MLRLEGEDAFDDINIEINDQEISSSTGLINSFINANDPTPNAQPPNDKDDDYQHTNFSTRLKMASYAGGCELLIALSYCLAVLPFLAKNTRWYNNPFMLLSLLLINFVSRLTTLENYKSLKLPLQITRGTMFASIDIETVDMLFHELGHYLFVMFFLNARRRIVIYTSILQPHAATYFYGNQLTELGEQVGADKSKIIIEAAGPAFQLTRSFIGLIISQAVSNKYPELSTYMRVRVTYSLLNLFFYSMTPYMNGCQEGNDFCDLEKNGIPPYAAALVILGSVLFLQCMLSCLGRSKKNVNELNHSIKKQETSQVELLRKPSMV